MWWRQLAGVAARVAPRRCVRRLAGSAARAAGPEPGPGPGPGPGPDRMPRSLVSRHRGLRQPARVILDVHEEEDLARRGRPQEDESALLDPLDAWSSARGRTGVFDVEELVSVLDEEGMEDICVLRLPEEHAYVSHLVLVTARSHQHMLATAQLLKKLFKRKRSSTDPVPRIEGKASRHWIAMDFVNIALHLFDSETRAQYDVDALWAVGPQYDDMSQPDALLTDVVDPLAEFTPCWPPEQADLTQRTTGHEIRP